MFRPTLFIIVGTLLQMAGCRFPTERPPEGYPISELEQSTRVIHFNVGQADAMLLVHRGFRYFLTAVRPWKIRNES